MAVEGKKGREGKGCEVPGENLCEGNEARGGFG